MRIRDKDKIDNFNVLYFFKLKLYFFSFNNLSFKLTDNLFFKYNSLQECFILVSPYIPSIRILLYSVLVSIANLDSLFSFFTLNIDIIVIRKFVIRIIIVTSKDKLNIIGKMLRISNPSRIVEIIKFINISLIMLISFARFTISPGSFKCKYFKGSFRI